METSEIQLIRSIWKHVDSAMVHHGVEIFINLFEKHPETKAKFPRLDTRTPEVMRKSPRMRAHVSRVLTSIGNVVSSLDDMEMLEETIFLLGESHKERGLVGEDMKKFAVVFLDYLKDTLGSDIYTTNAEAAYQKMMDIFTEKICNYMDGNSLVTGAELEQLRSIWAMVEPDRVHHGVEILIRLFDRYPETRARFKRLTTTGAEAMRKSPRVRAHAGRVVAAIGNLIAGLEDGDMVDEAIVMLGESHNKRGVGQQDFEKFANVFCDYLKEALGDALPQEAADAYSKLMGAFNSKINNHLDR